MSSGIFGWFSASPEPQPSNTNFFIAGALCAAATALGAAAIWRCRSVKDQSKNKPPQGLPPKVRRVAAGALSAAPTKPPEALRAHAEIRAGIPVQHRVIVGGGASGLSHGKPPVATQP